MKKLFSLLVILLPLYSYAQAPEGFWGLSYGMSEAEVRTIVEHRTGKMPVEGSGDGTIAYRNCEFAGEKVYLVQLHFFNDRLYGGDFSITSLISEPESVYNNIVQDVNLKYAGKDHRNAPLNVVYDTEKVRWIFGDSPAEILVTIEAGIIRLKFRDGKISGERLAALEQFNSADY